MKRCIICGNIGDENSTVCEVCGNPYLDIEEDTPVASESDRNAAPGQPEGHHSETEERAAVETSSDGAVQAEHTEKNSAEAEHAEAVSGDADRTAASPAGKEENGGAAGAAAKQGRAEGRAPHRMKSGPQIYGQAQMSMSERERRQQGTVRRTVQGRPGGVPQGNPAGYPGNQTQGNPAGRPANRPQGNPAGRPANRPQGNPAGYPGSQMQGGPAGRPGNQMQGGPAGYPGNRMQGGPAGYPGNRMQGGSSRQIMENARAVIKSPVFVLIAILHTVYLVSSVAAVFLNELNYSQVVRLISGISLPAQMSGYVDSITKLLSSLDSGAIVANLVIRIPDLLFCIGLWLIVITVRTAKEEMSGAGFVFVKATVIIEMIKNCIFMILILVVSVALVIAAWVSKAQGMLVVAIITLVLTIVAAMMIIMYYFCFLATIKTCRRNAGTGEVYGKASGYVAVVHIILALTSVINLLSGIVNAEISGITGAVGRMGWMILFGIWIFMYKSRMSEVDPE
ncbi:MAG: hypothetical protein SOX32_00860 [Candidatus Choladocola sp.]|nr:hypothetical protein [Candidatus Choladocola sp.]